MAKKSKARKVIKLSQCKAEDCVTVADVHKADAEMQATYAAFSEGLELNKPKKTRTKKVKVKTKTPKVDNKGAGYETATGNLYEIKADTAVAKFVQGIDLPVDMNELICFALLKRLYRVHLAMDGNRIVRDADEGLMLYIKKPKNHKGGRNAIEITHTGSVIIKKGCYIRKLNKKYRKANEYVDSVYADRPEDGVLPFDRRVPNLQTAVLLLCGEFTAQPWDMPWYLNIDGKMQAVRTYTKRYCSNLLKDATVLDGTFTTANSLSKS